MERKEGNEDTVTNIKVENSIFVKPEFIKKEPAPVYLDTYIEDHRQAVSDISLDQIKTELSVESITFEQNQDDLAQFQYFNSDVDNIKLGPRDKGSQSSQHDSFKTEIKEELNRESTRDTFDDSDLNEYSLKIDVEEEKKLMPYGEEQTNEKHNFKNEIKEGPNRESTRDTFDDSDLNEYSLKIEIEEEKKLMPYGEERTNEKDSLQEKGTLEIMKTIEVHSANKEQHTSQTAEEKTLNCEICLKQLSTASTLKVHMRRHTGEKPHKCVICFKQFSRVTPMKQHMRIHTGEKPYKCEICFKQFKDADYLKKHLRVHTGEKPYICEVCHNQFSQKSSLTTHLKIHTGEKPFKCGTCFKQFLQAGNLRQHIKLHTKEKSYNCEICLKQFSREDNLKSHMRIHTGEKPFKCEICLKRFNEASKVKRHLKIHTKEKH
ncbi:zinc finger protein 813-like isoform X5 [Diabrotica virgifera virgifera]|uniref:C2H2-type domain-containing protein n=1 Tax=Diabrotica virgifera virgifera TaxID=50390 RepID=A0ABM5KV93_DIAVI|nr:zinc finger protein 813-like isoform X5 [Diabrotica virgifera virgifera]